MPGLIAEQMKPQCSSSKQALYCSELTQDQSHYTRRVFYKIQKEITKIINATKKRQPPNPVKNIFLRIARNDKDK